MQMLLTRLMDICMQGPSAYVCNGFVRTWGDVCTGDRAYSYGWHTVLGARSYMGRTWDSDVTRWGVFRVSFDVRTRDVRGTGMSFDVRTRDVRGTGMSFDVRTWNVYATYGSYDGVVRTYCSHVDHAMIFSNLLRSSEIIWDHLRFSVRLDLRSTNVLVHFVHVWSVWADRSV
jgi:hypothetical protein